MTDYQKYINALRKCAKEHENDRTSTGHIIVSDLCRDTANLLEKLKEELVLDGVNKPKCEGRNIAGGYQPTGFSGEYNDRPPCGGTCQQDE